MLEFRILEDVLSPDVGDNPLVVDGEPEIFRGPACRVHMQVEEALHPALGLVRRGG